MLTELSVPFVDTTPDTLALGVGLGRLEAIASAVVQNDRFTVELRLLGASHQILVSSDGQIMCSETVACLQSSGAPDADRDGLPRSYVERLDSCRYRFSSTITHFDQSQFDHHVTTAVTAMASDERFLLGRFPGSPLAVTGIGVVHIDEREVRWQTMHAYPHHRSVVETEASMVLSLNLEPA